MQEEQTLLSTTKDSNKSCSKLKETVNTESEAVSRLNVSNLVSEPEQSLKTKCEQINGLSTKFIPIAVRYAFKKIKQNYLMECSLKNITACFLQSEIYYLSSLDHLKVDLEQASRRLMASEVLDQDECKDLYNFSEKGNNWEVLVHISQQCQKIFTEAFTHKAHSETYQLLHQLEDVSESFQVYKEQYLRISRIINTISIAESRLVLKALQSNTSSSPAKTNKQITRQSKTCIRVLNSIDETKMIQSEIVEDTEIPTEYRLNQQQQPTQSNYEEFEQLFAEIGKIRKHIFKPFAKLCQFIQLVTQYLCYFKRLHSKDVQIPGMRKLSVLFNKIMCNKYQMLMNDDQNEIVKWIMYKFPNLFFGPTDIFPDKFNKGLQQTMEINIQQNQEQLSSSPLIMTFNSFPIFFMGIPCEVYLLTNYLIIVESSGLKFVLSTGPSVLASNIKMKNKKPRQVNKLAVVHIDHSTKIEIISSAPTYQKGFLLYISGGMKSSGVQLQFRPKQINPVDMNKHISICRGEKNNKFVEQYCQICSGSLINKWQQSSALSNIQIFKQIIELTCAYQNFLHSCYYHSLNILIPSQFVDDFSVGKIATHRNTGIVKPNSNSQQLLIQYMQESNSILGLHSIEAEQIIPTNRLLSVTVQAVQHSLIDEQQQKSYLLELSIRKFINYRWHDHKKMKNTTNLHQSTNNGNICQIVQLNQQQVKQLEEYIFKTFPQIISQSANSYFSILKLHQAQQLYLSASSSAQQMIDVECTTIANLLNTLFKQSAFRSKPELVCTKLKMSQGFWKILTHGVDYENIRRVHNENFQIYGIGRQINMSCKCFQCNHLSEDSQLELISSRFSTYYNKLLSTPYSEQYGQLHNNNDPLIFESYKKVSNVKKQHKADRQKQKLVVASEKRRSAFVRALFKFFKIKMKFRNPYCQSFALRLQQNYYSDLLKRYNDISFQKQTNSISSLITDFFNKVKYSCYQSKKFSNDFCPSLLNIIQPTLKLDSLNVKLYCLPQIYDYYHYLQPFTQPIQPNIFKQIQEQECCINMPANHGFTSKLIIGIHKDTTCKHLKYIIGQRLGLKQDYIMDLMETFSLAIFKKEEFVNKSMFQSFFGKLLHSSKKSSVQLRLKQIQVLYDHQRVYDVLSLLRKNKNYYIGLRKYYKLDQPLLSVLQASEHHKIDKENSLIQSYYLSLQYQLAEIVYKLNNGSIRINSDTCQFLTQYIAHLFCYLHILMREQKNKFKEKQCLPLDQRLLIKTGIISKHLFQILYNHGLEDDTTKLKKIDQFNSKKLESEVRSSRRKSLIQLCNVYLENIATKQQILNKIFMLVYECTSWNSDVESVLYIKSKSNYTKCFIFISSQGVIIRSEQAHIENNKSNQSVMKSVLKSKMSDNSQQLFLEFDYNEIQIELTCSTLIIIDKQQKHKFFTMHPYSLMDKIKFYQAYSRLNPIQRIQCFESKLKIKFSQQNKQNSRTKLKNLQLNSANFIESETRNQKIIENNQKEHVEGRKKLSKLEEQFIIQKYHQ